MVLNGRGYIGAKVDELPNSFYTLGPLNLIKNGSFFDHADGWFGSGGDIGVTWSDTESVLDDGSGSVVATAEAPSAALRYMPGGNHLIPIDSLTNVEFSFMAKSASDTATVQGGVAFVHMDGGFVMPTNTVTSTVPLYSHDWMCASTAPLTVPDGTTHAFCTIALGETDGTPIHIDNVYFGAARAPFDAADIPFDGNRLPNGHFQNNVDWWLQWNGDEALVHETAQPLTGMGSLKVTTTGNGSDGIYSAYGVPVVPGETLRVSFKARATCPLTATILYLGHNFTNFGSTDVDVFDGTLTGAVQTISQDLTVPAGNTFAQLAFITSSASPVSFTLDDIYVGTPA